LRRGAHHKKKGRQESDGPFRRSHDTSKGGEQDTKKTRFQNTKEKRNKNPAIGVHRQNQLQRSKDSRGNLRGMRYQRERKDTKTKEGQKDGENDMGIGKKRG